MHILLHMRLSIARLHSGAVVTRRSSALCSPWGAALQVGGCVICMHRRYVHDVRSPGCSEADLSPCYRQPTEPNLGCVRTPTFIYNILSLPVLTVPCGMLHSAAALQVGTASPCPACAGTLWTPACSSRARTTRRCTSGTPTGVHSMWHMCLQPTSRHLHVCRRASEVHAGPLRASHACFAS